MKKINLRLCVAGVEALLPKFKACLKSYQQFFEIDELVVYTTANLYKDVKKIAPFAKIYEVNEFYKKNYAKFPESVKEILAYSNENNFCHELPENKEKKLFYERIRFVMDYYLIAGTKPFILSDIDIKILKNIKPILDWLESDYLLYNADYFDEPSVNNPEIFKFFGKDFFEKLPLFNCGWMCIPKGITIDMEEVCEIVKQDIGSYVAEQIGIAVVLIRNKVKTKLLPRELMVTKKWQFGKKNKTLAHFFPYGLGDLA